MPTYPTLRPKPPQPSKPAKPFPTPTPQPIIHPNTTAVPKPIMTKVHGKPVVDARSMSQSSELINGQHWKRLWLVDQDLMRQSVSFENPSTASSKNATTYAKVKMFITNPTFLPIISLGNKSYYLVNKDVYNKLPHKTDASFVVPIFSEGNSMFTAIDYNTLGKENDIVNNKKI